VVKCSDGVEASVCVVKCSEGRGGNLINIYVHSRF